MDRPDFLRLIGWTEQRLKNNILRGHLPFFSRTQSSKWQRHEYTGRRAVLMVIAEELTRDGGLAWEMAATVLRRREDDIFGGRFVVLEAGANAGEIHGRMAGAAALLPTDDTVNDIWLGVAEHPRMKEPRFVLGKLTDIVADLNEGLASVDDGPIFSRLFLANVTDAIRRVEARAADYGIALDAD